MTGATRHPLPIEDYAVVTDARSSALIGRDGTIDWWPLPTLHAPPVFAALVDPEEGGCFRLTVDGATDTTRRYLPGTNVLETRITTPSGAVTVTDALNVGAAGRLPWSELARRVEGIQGQVQLRWEVRPGTRLGDAHPTVGSVGGTPVLRLDDQHLAVVTSCPAESHDGVVGGCTTVRSGDRCLIALVGTDDEPLPLPAVDDIDRRIDATVDHWLRFSDLVRYSGPWSEQVQRSALALKTLLYEPAGAMAAAVTTSLPERIGGPKNWDYRYAWVRDSSFALDAMISLGLREEVHGAVSWLLSALRGSAPELHVFYTLDGEAPGGATELDVPGYRASRPVRAGNGASTQTQLGSFGDLFDTICRYVDAGSTLDPTTAALLASYADRCVEQWDRADSGIWELGDLQHYTISKIGCWVALDRAARLADAGQLPAARAGRWRAEADTVRRWVQDHCWSAAKGSYTFHADTDGLDAAVLLAGRTGFDRGPRLASTCEAVCRELGVPGTPLLYRYTGMDVDEGAFVACTFWLVEALALTGQQDRARQLMDEAVGLVNDVGLLSEEVDPGTGGFLGNLPQGLSHLALINAAVILDQARGELRDP